MAKYRLTNKAIGDLSDIWNYTFETRSEKQADIYYRFLLKNCRQLAGNQKLGKHYDEVAVDLLGYKTGQHILFYRIVSKEEIEVIRILHSRIDLKNRMHE